MAGSVIEVGRVRISLEVPLESLSGSVLVTGFRGFGAVGFNVSKYLALGLGARKIGFIVTRPLPPLIVMEEDGVGFPYDIYYSPRANTLIIVNRAVPDKETADELSEAIAELARKITAKYSVLVGGLNSNFMPEDEKYGFRHLPNKYYNGPRLEAPEMEEDLGVMGPLALVFVYMTLKEVPAIIVLPYAEADQIDIDAARRGILVIARDLLGVEVNLKSLDEYEAKLKREKEKLYRMIQMLTKSGSEGGEEEGKKGMYM